MANFGFNEITPASQADITKVMENFEKINTLGMTAEEIAAAITAAIAFVTSATDTKLSEYTKTVNLSGLATTNYSYGTAAPSGGNNGDVYDQYFD